MVHKHVFYYLLRMNSLQIAAALQLLPLNTMVYAANRLPNSIPLPSGLVVNTDPDYKPGSHWVAIFIDKHRCGEYFDSFGFPPTVDAHLKFLRTTCRKWIHNEKGLQSYNSTVCGQYCFLFLYYKAKGCSLREFQSLFSEDSQKNDALVRRLFAGILKRASLCKPFSNSRVQVCTCRRFSESKGL